MFCPKCGVENSSQARFCKNCGGPISGSQFRKWSFPETGEKIIADYFFDVLKKYAVFKGRANRKEYWMFYLACVVIQLELFFVCLAHLGIRRENIFLQLSHYFSYHPIRGPLIILILLIPSAALFVRRFNFAGHIKTVIYIAMAFIYSVFLFWSLIMATDYSVNDTYLIFGDLLVLSLLVPIIAVTVRKYLIRVVIYSVLFLAYVAHFYGGFNYIWSLDNFWMLFLLLLLAGGALLMLALLIPSVAVAVRRLHDTDHSAWWLLMNFLPLVGGIVFIVILAMEGDQGYNQYGYNPKEIIG